MGVCESKPNIKKPKIISDQTNHTQERPLLDKVHPKSNIANSQIQMTTVSVQTDPVLVFPMPSQPRIFKMGLNNNDKDQEGSASRLQGSMQIEGIEEKDGEIVGLLVKETPPFSRKSRVKIIKRKKTNPKDQTCKQRKPYSKAESINKGGQKSFDNVKSGRFNKKHRKLNQNSRSKPNQQSSSILKVKTLKEMNKYIRKLSTANSRPILTSYSEYLDHNSDRDRLSTTKALHLNRKQSKVSKYSKHSRQSHLEDPFFNFGKLKSPPRKGAYSRRLKKKSKTCMHEKDHKSLHEREIMEELSARKKQVEMSHPPLVRRSPKSKGPKSISRSSIKGVQNNSNSYIKTTDSNITPERKKVNIFPKTRYSIAPSNSQMKRSPKNLLSPLPFEFLKAQNSKNATSSSHKSKYLSHNNIRFMENKMRILDDVSKGSSTRSITLGKLWRKQSRQLEAQDGIFSFKNIVAPKSRNKQTKQKNKESQPKNIHAQHLKMVQKRHQSPIEIIKSESNEDESPKSNLTSIDEYCLNSKSKASTSKKEAIQDPSIVSQFDTTNKTHPENPEKKAIKVLQRGTMGSGSGQRNLYSKSHVQISSKTKNLKSSKFGDSSQKKDKSSTFLR